MIEEAHLLLKMGSFNESIESFQRIRKLNMKSDEDADTYVWISYCLFNTNRNVQALDELKAGLEKYPNHQNITFALSNFYLRHGDIESCLNQLDNISENCIEVISNKLDKLQYNFTTLEYYKNVSLKCQQFLEKPKSLPKYNNNSLRIGYICSDFISHPVGFLALPILDNNSYCYHNTFMIDNITESIKKTGANFKSIAGKSDDEVVDLIKKDKIDILMDLSGHSSGNRIRVFSKRAAPIQISWFGWSTSTGITNMDYKLIDEWHAPKEFENLYTEKLLKLPDTYLLFSPYFNVKLEDYKAKDHITFASFNNLAKINKEVLKAWREILLNVPNSNLIIKYGTANNEFSKTKILNMLNIDSSRIVFENKTNTYPMFLKKYNEVDIMLDTFPFSGGMTSLNSLYMSTPVITTYYQSASSRQTYAFLNNINHKELIAESVDEYIEKACNLANDSDRIKKYKNSLRNDLLTSPLTDKETFMKNLYNLLNSL
jgi:predicted O-linked N-acetylglucosamine transferase (SPINDLY family)